MNTRHVSILSALDNFLPLDLINTIEEYDYYLTLNIAKVITNVYSDKIYSIKNNKIIYNNVQNKIHISDSDPRNNLKLRLNNLDIENIIIYSFPDTQNIVLNSTDGDDISYLEFYYPPYNLNAISKDRKFLIKFNEHVNVIIQLPNLDYCFGLNSGDIEIWGEYENSLVLKSTLVSHTNRITDMIIVPYMNSFTIISLSPDSTIRIWDMETQTTKLILKDELQDDDERSELKYIGNNKILFIGYSNIILWDYTKGLKLNSIESEGFSTLILDDKILINYDDKISFLSAETLELITDLNYPNIRDIQILPDNNIIMIDDSGLVSILNSQTYQIDRSFQTDGDIKNITVLSNGLCAINKEGFVEILD